MHPAEYILLVVFAALELLFAPVRSKNASDLLPLASGSIYPVALVPVEPATSMTRVAQLPRHPLLARFLQLDQRQSYTHHHP